MKVNKAAVGNLPLKTERDAGGEKAERSSNKFDLDMFKFQDGMVNQRLQKLLAAIDEAGQKLATVPTYSELKGYRTLVQQYMGEAVNNMYELEHNRGWDSRGRQKVHTIIKRVDKELEGLSSDMCADQDRQLRILARLDSIRGLLVDIYS